jgi:hypothetical protein
MTLPLAYDSCIGNRFAKNRLWRSQRGSYSVEDEQFLEWLAQLG